MSPIYLIAFLSLTCLPLTLSITLSYDIFEESGTNKRVGNVLQDSNIVSDMTPQFISSLLFKFVAKGYEHTRFFTISSGKIYTAINLNRESVCKRTECTLSLMVAVQSSIEPSFIETIGVNVRILDINDDSPHFLRDSITLSIPESVSIGTSYRIPSAEDNDLDNNGIIKYEMDPASSQFSIRYTKNLDKTFAVDIIIQKSLDREISPSHKIRIVAKDGGSPARTGEMIVNVNITDTNDHAPVFTQESYTVKYKENIAVNTVLLTVSATDKDQGINAHVYYYINGQTDREIRDQFKVDEASGAITLHQPLDYEKHHEIQFVVEAVDGGSQAHTSQALVVIKVENVNDNAPKVHFNLLSPVPENARIGHFIVLLMVSDADNVTTSDVVCKINTHLFKLQSTDSHQYKLLLNTTLNREHVPLYDVIISCRDGGFPAHITNKPLRIDITDVNDNTPSFTESFYEKSINENCIIGTYVLTVKATDDDIGENKRITYQLSREAYPYFTVNSRNGVITTSGEIDREFKDKHTFLVIAKDNGNPSLESSRRVTITINDLNDITPEFTNDHITFYFPENEKIQSVVGKVTAKDKDIGNNSQLIYSILPNGDTIIPFTIDSKYGIIYSADVYDREEQPEYHFKVTATDSGTPQLTGTISVLVSISDTNDNDPVIVVPKNKSYKISFKAKSGAKLFLVKAYDRDSGVNSKLHYNVIKGNENNMVEIDDETGQITTSRDYTEDDKGDYSILVEVTDSSTPPKISIATFTFSVVSQTSANDTDHLMIIIILCVATICVACLILAIIFILRRRRNKHLQRLRMSGVRENGDAVFVDSTLQQSPNTLMPYHKNCEVIRQLNGGTMSKMSPRSDNQVFMLNSPKSYSSVYTVDQHVMQLGSPKLTVDLIPSSNQQYDEPSRCSTPIAHHPSQYSSPSKHHNLTLPTDPLQMKQINDMLQRLDTHSDTSGDSGRGQSEEDNASLQHISHTDQKRYPIGIQKPPRSPTKQHNDVTDKISSWMHTRTNASLPNRKDCVTPNRVTFHPDLDEGYIHSDVSDHSLHENALPYDYNGHNISAPTPRGGYQNCTNKSTQNYCQKYPVNGVNNHASSHGHMSTPGHMTSPVTDHMSSPFTFYDGRGLRVNETLNDTVFEASGGYTDNDSDTTTSGSYVVDADQLVNDIDHMFFAECQV